MSSTHFLRAFFQGPPTIRYKSGGHFSLLAAPIFKSRRKFSTSCAVRVPPFACIPRCLSPRKQHRGMFFCVRPFCRIPGTLTLDMTVPLHPPRLPPPIPTPHPLHLTPRQLLVNFGEFEGTRERLIKGSALLPCEPSRSPGRPPQSASWVIFKVTGLCTSSWPRWAPTPSIQGTPGGGH